MLYSEIIAVYSEIHTKRINTVCGQNVEFLVLNIVVPIVVKVQSVPRSKHTPSRLY
jgi:hypothetical protein